MHDAVLETPINILPDEQLENLQLRGLRILQKKRGFRFGSDAVLLADFAQIAPHDHVADFGTGTGILPLLLYGREKGERFDAMELQPEMADMAFRCMVINGLQDTIRVHNTDVSQAVDVLGRGSIDHVICNPPYGSPGRTLLNPQDDRRLARHQGEEGLAPWITSAAKVLRYHGKLSMIYPAAMLVDLIVLLRENRLEPKRMRMIYHTAASEAKLVLVEASCGGRPGLRQEPPLILAEADGSMTNELKRIYHMETSDE